MVRELRVGLWALLVAVGLLATQRARAQEREPAPVFVLTVMTDDADDQAEALTRALRARVEALSGWSVEARQRVLGADRGSTSRKLLHLGDDDARSRRGHCRREPLEPRRRWCPCE